MTPQRSSNYDSEAAKKLAAHLFPRFHQSVRQTSFKFPKRQIFDTPEKQKDASAKQNGSPAKQDGSAAKQSGSPAKQSGSPAKQNGASAKQNDTPEKQKDTKKAPPKLNLGSVLADSITDFFFPGAQKAINQARARRAKMRNAAKEPETAEQPDSKTKEKNGIAQKSKAANGEPDSKNGKEQNGAKESKAANTQPSSKNRKQPNTNQKSKAANADAPPKKTVPKASNKPNRRLDDRKGKQTKPKEDTRDEAEDTPDEDDLSTRASFGSLIDDRAELLAPKVHKKKHSNGKDSHAKSKGQFGYSHLQNRNRLHYTGDY